MAEENNDAVITNACESAPYRLAFNVQERDSFWLKGQLLVYSFVFDERAPKFAGGTIYRAFLSVLSYRCLHCPASVKTFVQPGTYHAGALVGEFAKPDPPGPDRAAPDLSHACYCSLKQNTGHVPLWTINSLPYEVNEDNIPVGGEIAGVVLLGFSIKIHRVCSNVLLGCSPKFFECDVLFSFCYCIRYRNEVNS